MKYWISLIMFFILFSCKTKDNNLQRLIKADQQSNEEKRAFSDVSQSYFNERSSYIDSLVSGLKKIERSSLSQEDKINYDVFSLIQMERQGVLKNGMYKIPFDAEVGFHNEINYYLNGIQINTIEDLQKYLNKLKAYPQYLRDNILLLKSGIKDGIVSNSIIASKYKEQILPFVSKDSSDNVFISVLEKASKNISGLILENYRDTLSNIVFNEIIPAYNEYDSFMIKEYLPSISDNPGISSIGNGKAFYENRIKYYTTLEMTAEDVYQMGIEEVRRIRKEMQGIIDGLGYEGSYSDFLNFLRTDPQFYAKSPRQLLEFASYYSKRIDGKLPEYFGKLPRLPYGVSPVPEAIAPHYTSGRYSPGSMKNHRAGHYWVNTHNLQSRPLYAIPALTLHEAVPGHHLHFALTEELGDLPEFRNTYISAFGEGWALYCEHLGNEMGIYETPYEQFGRLTYEMWRACRLVVDPGIHMKGWSRQKALDFLMENTALSVHECNTEIDRYIGWPGQAVSYKIGELKIKELRAIAEAKLGEGFDIRAFHDLILKNGSIPLSTLEEIVMEYLQENKLESNK